MCFLGHNGEEFFSEAFYDEGVFFHFLPGIYRLRFRLQRFVTWLIACCVIK